jgi:hypothetical protein
MLNGMTMLDVNFPLSELIGICEYPFAKGDCEPIGDFFFSRGIGSKTRMDQAMMDEMYKQMIVATRYRRKPSLANEGNYDIGPSVYVPGKIFKGINPDKLRPIGDVSGVTPAEFNMVQFVKSVIDDKTVDPIFQGEAPENKATARQVMLQKQQSMVKIGMAMLGIINLETKIAWLRIHNINKHWTEAVDTKTTVLGEKIKESKQYRTIVSEDTLDNGQRGINIVQFTDKVPADEQVLAEEQLLENKMQRKVRKTYVNAEIYKVAKFIWKVTVVPVEKQTNLLKAAMFEDSVQKAAAIFLPLGKRPNIDYWAERWAVLNDENPDRFWQETPGGMGLEMQAMMAGGGAQGQMPQIPGMQQAMQPKAPARPSINTVAGGQ